jgi:hypothetical protein
VLAVINDVTTSGDASISTKFASTKMSSDYVRLLILANPPWKLPMSTDERRFFILNPSNEYLGNDKYYTTLDDNIKDQRVIEALMYRLKNVTLDKFNVRVMPYTDAMLDQAVKNLKKVPRWFFETIIDGKLDYWKKESDGTIYVLRDTMRKAYKDFHDVYYPKDPIITPIEFGLELRKLLPALDINGNVIKRKGNKIESILDETRQRDTAIRREKPDIVIEKGKRDSDFSYSYILLDLVICKKLFNIAELKNLYVFEDEAKAWRDRDPM